MDVHAVEQRAIDIENAMATTAADVLIKALLGKAAGLAPALHCCTPDGARIAKQLAKDTIHQLI
jgi:hypothetical protein